MIIIFKNMYIPDAFITKPFTQADVNNINEGFSNINKAFESIQESHLNSHNYLLDRIRRIEREVGIKHPEQIIDIELKKARKKKGKNLTEKEIIKIINKIKKKLLLEDSD